MEDLIDEMKVVLATSFHFYLKAQFFHWNVTGINFVQLHDFFGKLYEEVQGSIDVTAEQIRALDDFSPGSFKRFSELSLISDTEIIPSDESMVKILLADNDKILNQLSKTFRMADNYDQQGLADFISSRLDAHKKHAWMLKSIIRK